MIWEILLRLAVYVLHHSTEVWTAALGCGLIFLIERLNAEKNASRTLPMKRALWQALQVARAIHRLFITAAFVIVNSAYMLLVGWWKEWMVSVAVTTAAATVWRRLPISRRQPTT